MLVMNTNDQCCLARLQVLLSVACCLSVAALKSVWIPVNTVRMAKLDITSWVFVGQHYNQVLRCVR